MIVFLGFLLATLAVVALWVGVAQLERIAHSLGNKVEPRVRMPWESDGSTFNVVKKNMTDDGMG